MIGLLNCFHPALHRFLGSGHSYSQDISPNFQGISPNFVNETCDTHIFVFYNRRNIANAGRVTGILQVKLQKLNAVHLPKR